LHKKPSLLSQLSAGRKRRQRDFIPSATAQKIVFTAKRFLAAVAGPLPAKRAFFKSGLIAAT
jgi:hypothetical protein